MPYSAADWQHLGDCLRAERDARPRSEVARDSGISHATIEAYESGRVYNRPPDKLWRLINYYRWTPDSLRKVLEGGLPTHLPKSGKEATPAKKAPPVETWIRDLIRNCTCTTLSSRDKTKILRHYDELLRAGQNGRGPRNPN